jgi:hypothetical protein
MIAKIASRPTVVRNSQRSNAAPLRQWLSAWYTVLIAEILCWTSVEIA